MLENPSPTRTPRHKVQNPGHGSLRVLTTGRGRSAVVGICPLCPSLPSRLLEGEQTPTGVLEDARTPACVGSSPIAEHELCSFSKQAQLPGA